MPLLENNHHTSEDYWNLPEDERAELIDGKFYNMAPPEPDPPETREQTDSSL